MLSYVDEGAAEQPAVLFLHGFMGSGADWSGVVEALRRQYRCVCVDLPGHGASRGLPAAAYTVDGVTEALAGVLDALGLAQAAVVGYSMGGRMALAFAVRYPARCRRLVVESASPGLRTDAERAARRAADEARAARLEAEGLAAFVADWYRQPLFESLYARPDLRDAMQASRLRNDPHELARALRGLGPAEQPSYWEALCTRLLEMEVPILAVAGARDGTYAEVVERMGVLNPWVRTAIVPNAGHNVHAEYPSAFVDLLADFLGRPA